MAKPSKRVAVRQAELSKRKRQHRPMMPGVDAGDSSAGSTVAEPLAEDETRAVPEAAKSPVANVPARHAPGQTGTAQATFRQPSFRGARTVSPTANGEAATVARRPMPKSPYQGRDLRAIGYLTTLLLAGLLALKLLL